MQRRMENAMSLEKERKDRIQKDLMPDISNIVENL